MDNKYDTYITVHQLFEKQVNITPERIAIVDDKTSLTYQELDNKANQLANYLLTIDDFIDQPIGICLNRSLNSFISILGIIKAGGAFMPLDSCSPEPRLKSILINSKVKTIISQNNLKNKFHSYDGKLVLIDSHINHIDELGNNRPDISVSPRDLAYIIHTSGSTGEPKGIATEHEPLANLILWHKKVLQDGGLNTLGFMPLTFDASIQEFFTTCCSGGTYFVASNTLRQKTDKLSEFVIENEIQRLFMTFTPLQHFIKTVEDSKLNLINLKSIINVGEPLIITQLFRDFFTRHPDCELHNQYGLTETAVDMTDYKFHGTPENWPERPSAGYPITNAKIYILDENLKPVKENEIGQIFVGGMSLAREFVNKPELTNEKFISDPFSKEANNKIYETGDLGKWLSDGSFQCLGRKDSQVKIRGFRVELGEIQTAILQHPGIKETVAMLYELQPGEKELVAYLVCNQGKAPGILELRTYLEERLPDYMIPHKYVFMESLPMTAHGKIDRKSLPIPGTTKRESEFIAPRNDIEKDIAIIWQNTLKTDKVSINDNFFIFGGDSLLAAQLLLKIEKIFEIEIALGTLYEKPTIAKLSPIIIKKIDQQKEQEETRLAELLDQIENMNEEEIDSLLNTRD